MFTTFLNQKNSYFCKINVNKLSHLWSSHLYFHTFTTITHGNRPSVLLNEWTPYPNDSVSKKNNKVNLSNKILTTEQTIIQNKGLSFCQSKTKIKFCQDNEVFIRKVRLMEYHQNSDIHYAKETPLMQTTIKQLDFPSSRNVHVNTFVDTARKQWNFFLSMTILLKSVISTTTKSIPLMNSPKMTVSPSKKLTKRVLLCSSTHVIASTVVRIFRQTQKINKRTTKKSLRVHE